MVSEWQGRAPLDQLPCRRHIPRRAQPQEATGVRANRARACAPAISSLRVLLENWFLCRLLLAVGTEEIKTLHCIFSFLANSLSSNNIQILHS